MTTKEHVLRVIEGLPEEASLSEILERIRHLEPVGALDHGSTTKPTAPEQGVWNLLRSSAGAVEMPTDWAGEHDHYLYGTPKRSSAS